MGGLAIELRNYEFGMVFENQAQLRVRKPKALDDSFDEKPTVKLVALQRT